MPAFSRLAKCPLLSLIGFTVSLFRLQTSVTQETWSLDRPAGTLCRLVCLCWRPVYKNIRVIQSRASAGVWRSLAVCVPGQLRKGSEVVTPPRPRRQDLEVRRHSLFPRKMAAEAPGLLWRRSVSAAVF